MINEYSVKKYCCEDITLIENYEYAIDSEEKWECHHKLGIELNKSKQELIDIGLYYNRPASELIFLSQYEHQFIHHIGKPRSKETCEKISKSEKGRSPWNKNKKGIYSEETLKRKSESMKGKQTWLKGKKKVWNDESHTKYHYE